MSKDILEDIFKNMPCEAPSPHFKDNLMFIIQQEAVKENKRKHKFKILSTITASIIVITLIIFASIYFADINNMSIFADSVLFNLNLSQFKFPTFIMVIALFLLFVDFYLRQYLSQKRMNS